MDKKTWIILGVLIVGVGALLGVSIWQGKASRANYTNYDAFAINEPSEETGNYAENIEGNPDAPVVIYQYGNYQCTACAPMNPYINKLKEEYGDNIAIVFRHMYLPSHSNATAAAAAANAAAKQGYWVEFKDLVFANQNDWFYSDAENRQAQFEGYFMQASNNKGDLEQFRADMASKDVQKKIDYDNAMAEKAEASFTPSFYVEDEFIGQRREDNDGKDITTDQFLDKLRAAINKRLEEKGIKVEKNTDDDSN